MRFKIFLSSPRREFENERKYLKTEIERDSTLNSFFEVFSFEETSASGQPPVEVYSHEVVNSDIYIGLIGSDYGSVLESGISPTEYEYDLFKRAHNDAFVFVKNRKERDEKVHAFISKIKEEVTYQSFDDLYELLDKVKESLCKFLEKNLINYRAYDSQLLLDSSCDDVDMEAVEIFFRVCKNKSLKEVKEEKGIDHMLATINAGEFHEGEFKLNVAGALFFAKDISKFNIPHQVKMVHFLSDYDLSRFKKIDSNKSILKLLKDAEGFFDNSIMQVSHIKGFKRITRNQYPYEAVREALVNAIAHRDYTIASAPITFYIYPNKILIKSPGRLEYPLKVSSLGKHEVIHRNVNICNIFSNTNYMEHIGTGIKRMKDFMTEFGLNEPEFIEEGEFFEVTFDGNQYLAGNYELNDRQEALLASDISEITIQDYQKIFDVSRNTAVRDLNKLLEYHLVNKHKKGSFNIFKLINNISQ